MCIARGGEGGGCGCGGILKRRCGGGVSGRSLGEGEGVSWGLWVVSRRGLVERRVMEGMLWESDP